jgi:Flagellar hook-length control protein FliK
MVVPIRLDAGAIPSQFEISKQQPDARVLRLEAGQVLDGRVVSTAADTGTSRFIWSGYAFDLQLPESVAPGTQIQMKVTSTEGAIQLQYIGQGLQAAKSILTNQGVELSSVSQWLSGLMETLSIQALSADAPPQASIQHNAVESTQAIDSTSGKNLVDELANTLQQSIEKSGLFYESHQAQWVQGQKTLESLLTEPQAQWSPLLGGVPASGVGRGGNPFGIPDSLVKQITQQLGVLENQTVAWQGRVLPGVDMNWVLHPMNAEAIEDEEVRKRALNDEEQRPWITRLNFNLPSLGEIQASIQVYGNYLRWHLSAEKNETQTLLNQLKIQWVNALEARGMQVAGSVSGLYKEESGET